MGVGVGIVNIGRWVIDSFQPLGRGRRRGADPTSLRFAGAPDTATRTVTVVDTDSADTKVSKPKEPKPFDIKITYNGIEKELTVSDDEAISSVLTRAIALFPISEAQHLLALFDHKGTEITNEAQTVDEAGLKKNSRLVLRQSAVKGG